MKVFNKISKTCLVATALLLALPACTDQPVVVNNYYTTNSDGSVQSVASEQAVPDVSSKEEVSVSSETSTITSTINSTSPQTDSNLVVGINYTVTGTKNYLAIRNAPAYDGNNEIAKMKNGDELTIQSQNVYGDKGEYCYITPLSGAAKGQSGYVNKNYITPSTTKTNSSAKTTSSETATSKASESSKTAESKTESKSQSLIESKPESSTESEQKTSSKIDISNIFDEIPSEFYFTSGVGGWRTLISINSDGSFTGNFVDCDLGVTGSDYPNGSASICDFTGKFTNVTKIDDYTYSMKVVSLKQDGKEGDEYIEDGTKYTIANPYGFDDADEFILYLPGKPVSELSEEFLSWVRIGYSGETVIPDGVYGLYNVNGMQGFRGDK